MTKRVRGYLSNAGRFFQTAAEANYDNAADELETVLVSHNANPIKWREKLDNNKDFRDAVRNYITCFERLDSQLTKHSTDDKDTQPSGTAQSEPLE